MLRVDDVRYVVDENLLRLGAGLVAVRRDTARFSRPPVDDLLPQGILETEWIPIVGDHGWDDQMLFRIAVGLAWPSLDG